MSEPGYACPNGHPAVLAGQRFCEVCGAPVVALPPQPVAGPPVAPGAAPEPAPPPVASPPVAPPPVAPPPVASPPVAPPPVAPPQSAPPPAWSAPAAPPPGWSPQPAPAGYGVTPAPAGTGGGRGRGPIALVALLLVAVLAVGAVVFVVRPFGAGAGASPSPVAQASSTPRPVPTAEPSAAATAEPTTDPTDEPSAEPSGEPTLESFESAPPSTGPVETCRSETVGMTVSYPAGWYTYTGDPQWTCLLFDPAPIVIDPQTELPPVAVMMYLEARAYAATRKDFETAAAYTVNATDSGLIDQHDATAYELENTGQGYYDKGVLQAVVVVDLGDRGCLVIEAVGMPGAEYDANVDALITIGETLQID